MQPTPPPGLGRRQGGGGGGADRDERQPRGQGTPGAAPGSSAQKRPYWRSKNKGPAGEPQHEQQHQNQPQQTPGRGYGPPPPPPGQHHQRGPPPAAYYNGGGYGGQPYGGGQAYSAPGGRGGRGGYGSPAPGGYSTGYGSGYAPPPPPPPGGPCSTPGRGRGGGGRGRSGSTPMSQRQQQYGRGRTSEGGSGSYGTPPRYGGTPMHASSSSGSVSSSRKSGRRGGYFAEHLPGSLLQVRSGSIPHLPCNTWRLCLLQGVTDRPRLPAHPPRSARLQQGLKSGALFRCTFRTNPSDRSQGYCTLKGLPTDVFIRVRRHAARRYLQHTMRTHACLLMLAARRPLGPAAAAACRA